MRSPFIGNKRLIYHCAHHKMGTVWMMRVLEHVAAEFGLKLTKSNTQQQLPEPDTDILFANHSQFDTDSIGDFVGSHMIRDPRDVIVSGYFYHRVTDEEWVKRPRDQYQYNGKSYQELLNSVDEAEGLRQEILFYSSSADRRRLQSWNFHDARILEMRYEDLWTNESLGFQKMFRHYGFWEAAIKKTLKIAASQSFVRASKGAKNQGRKDHHLRSGQPGDWRKMLMVEHCELIKAEFGDLIVELGYEPDNDWQ